jgi:ubiquinone/menaquinone biosynthesis C-methylase UbiE
VENNVIDSYDKTAKAYAEKFADELSHKHFDRMILKAFAAENKHKGKLIDLGCGPGQTTKFLWECGIEDCIGTDISSGMITEAKSLYPQLSFEIADMLSLAYADSSFGSAIAFYSIVNFNYDQAEKAFKEVKRILKTNGGFLFSFHVGDEVVHLDNFLEQQVNIDFYFFETKKITALLQQTGFEVIDVMERQPYKDVEYVSTRAYIWARNI